jgi:glycosyltransferase involved in cell wall biosynthesis
LLDRIAFRAANLVVVDTAAHGRRFADDYGLDQERSVVVPVGAFDPWPLAPHVQASEDRLHVLYFGGFIPLHGVPVVLEAARRIDPDEGIHVDLVGEGQQAQDAADFLRHVPLPHVELHRGWVPEAELVERYVSCADVCLGVFAATPKAMDVVPAKIYLALACGRGVLTADTPAVREELLARAPDDDPVALCRAGDPGALAAALRGLRDDPDRLRRTAAAGRRLYERHFRPEQIVAPLAAAIDRLPAR